MPFPFESFPYGFRLRLRQLAAPVEAFNLQVSAPDFDGLEPIQPCHFLQHAIIEGYGYDSSVIYEVGYQAKSFYPTKNSVCNVWRTLELQKFDFPLTDYHRFFRRFSITAKQVTFKECSANGHFIEAVASCMPTVDQLTFSHCSINFGNPMKVISPTSLQFKSCKIDTAVFDHIASRLNSGLEELCFQWCTFAIHSTAAIPVIKNLKVMEIIWPRYDNHGNWLHKIASAGYTGMNKLYLQFVALDVLDVDPTDFVNFYKAQSDHFELQITFSYSRSARQKTQAKLDELFSENFYHCENHDVNLPRKICVKGFGCYFLPEEVENLLDW